jgi:uncharacterized protein YehS (DUF1456 family)
MNHNDVMRSLRYMLDINDQKMAEIIGLAGLDVNAEAIAGYLKKEEEPASYAARTRSWPLPRRPGDPSRGKDDSRPPQPSSCR